MTDPFGVCLEPECFGEAPPPPSTVDMLSGLLKSGKDIVKGAIISGEMIASQEVFDDRMSICRKCPLFIEETHRCSKCGCFMTTKARFVNVSCPDKRW